jgi:hypothetical protein
LEKQDDPNYFGVIKFEQPDLLFTYQAGMQELQINEVGELIEKITHYLDRPSIWLIDRHEKLRKPGRSARRTLATHPAKTERV